MDYRNTSSKKNLALWIETADGGHSSSRIIRSIVAQIKLTQRCVAHKRRHNCRNTLVSKTDVSQGQFVQKLRVSEPFRNDRTAIVAEVVPIKIQTAQWANGRFIGALRGPLGPSKNLRGPPGFSRAFRSLRTPPGPSGALRGLPGPFGIVQGPEELLRPFAVLRGSLKDI